MATNSLEKKLTHLKTGTHVIAIDDIQSIDYRKIASLEIVIETYDGHSYLTTGQDALEAMMALKPGALEGVPSIKWIKYSWVFHNLVGHPFMQLCALFGFTRFGLWVHDVTVPGKKRVKRLPS